MQFFVFVPLLPIFPGLPLKVLTDISFPLKDFIQTALMGLPSADATIVLLIQPSCTAGWLLLRRHQNCCNPRLRYSVARCSSADRLKEICDRATGMDDCQHQSTAIGLATSLVSQKGNVPNMCGEFLVWSNSLSGHPL